MMDKGVWLARYTAHDGDTNDKCAVKRGALGGDPGSHACWS
jgi:hypothetical protein